MNLQKLRRDATRALFPLGRWAQQCHMASLELVHLGIIDRARVARGWCRGVGGQHSWVVVGDPYDPQVIIDPTLWSYDRTVKGVWVGTMKDGKHRPQGYGNIWEYGRPADPIGPVVELKPSTPLSREAKRFLTLIGPLDRRGWMVLANSPVGGWPAAEIIAAMDDTPELEVLVPIDILGMLTDRDPGGLYLGGQG